MCYILKEIGWGYDRPRPKYIRMDSASKPIEIPAKSGYRFHIEIVNREGEKLTFVCDGGPDMDVEIHGDPEKWIKNASYPYEDTSRKKLVRFLNWLRRQKIQ